MTTNLPRVRDIPLHSHRAHELYSYTPLRRLYIYADSINTSEFLPPLTQVIKSAVNSYVPLHVSRKVVHPFLVNFFSP